MSGFGIVAFNSGSGSSGSSNIVTGNYTSFSGTIATFDAVSFDGTGAIKRATSVSGSFFPVLGFISQINGSNITIVYSGELAGFSGLIAGATYFISNTDGQITTAAPTISGNIVQRVGLAKTSTTLFVDIDQEYVAL